MSGNGERPSAEPFQVTAPPGRLWMMGGNRADSADSRDHPDDPGDGTIPESAVVGRTIAIIWPPSQVRACPFPATFAQPGLARQATAARQERDGASGAPALAGQAPRHGYVGIAALGPRR
jgi:signal peptidase I